MNAIPPSFTQSGEPGLQAEGGSAAAQRWHALDHAGRIVAVLAGGDPLADEPADISALLEATDPVRRSRAENGITDIAAFMEPGIAALLSVNSRGADTRPAAQALWHDFVRARSAVVSMLRPLPLEG